MAASDELGVLINAFSGFGVDEKALITILGKWNPNQMESFRKGNGDFFIEDERTFERWDEGHVLQLRHEFLRLKDAIVLWTMHPWERDARLLREALLKEPPQHNVLIEIACTRSSDELWGARKAYHSLFDHSVEEDVAFHVHTAEKKLLVGVLSSYRYEGPKVNEELAMLEATILHNAVKEATNNLIENEELLRILSTRSKFHLQAIYNHYKEISGDYIDEDLDGVDTHVIEAIQCLCVPQIYFSEVLDASLRCNADEITKEAVTRVIVTRADMDIKQIIHEYNQKYGTDLSEKIEDVAKGNYKDFLLTLLTRAD